jgi:predicted transcriptional regulator
MDVKEWAKFQQLLLRSQLKVIREFLKDDAEPEPPLRKKRSRSQVTIVYDILTAAKEPLHLSEIIKRAKENFNVDIDRESIASAMIKKINKGRMFRRVAPNTFEVLDASGNTS